MRNRNIGTLALTLVILVSLTAGCRVHKEVNYAEAIAKKQMTLKDVPLDKLTYDIYVSWVRLSPYNVLDVPLQELDNSMLTIALWSTEDVNTLDMVLDRLPDEAEWKLTDEQVDSLLNKHPGLLLRVSGRVFDSSNGMWAASHLRHALEATPHWGLYAAQEAPCDIVHLIPIEVWKKAAEKAPDTAYHKLPWFIAQELGLDHEVFRLGWTDKDSHERRVP